MFCSLFTTLNTTCGVWQTTRGIKGRGTSTVMLGIIRAYYYQKTKMIKTIFYIAVGITAVAILWKVATYDYCPLYYGIKCMPPYDEAK